MPVFQAQFLRFHQAIKLNNADENAILRDKRDAVIERMRRRLERSFEHFHQGSYAMGTGCVPLDGDYDIDVGIVFFGSAHERPDPVVVKRWVRDAVNGHTATPAKWMRHCVRVQYIQAGSPIYHVDLAVYWQDIERDYWSADPRRGAMYLAVGKEGAQGSDKEWQRAEPKTLRDKIAEYGQPGAERDQFKRVIRYLKRWRQVHFSSSGNASPVGIGLSVCALQWFRSNAAYGSTDATVDDLSALHSLVASMRSNFALAYRNSGFARRLQVKLPTEPRLDVFRKMSDPQMEQFEQQLGELDGLLQSAATSGEAKYLRRAFGDDFPAV